MIDQQEFQAYLLTSLARYVRKNPDAEIFRYTKWKNVRRIRIERTALFIQRVVSELPQALERIRKTLNKMVVAKTLTQSERESLLSKFV